MSRAVWTPSMRRRSCRRWVPRRRGRGPGFSWELRDFRIGRMEFDALELADLRIDGYAEDGEIRLTLAGAELHGTLERSGNGPWRLDLPELKVPASPTGEGVVLDPAVIDQLIAADVVLGQVFVGDEDYGTWRFGVRPVPEGIELHDVVAELRGLSIEAAAPAALEPTTGRPASRAPSERATLRDVLPQWDFVASVESERFAGEGSVRWPGSPLEFDVATLSGNASLDLVKGRFLDVEQGAGAARILSLINFSTIVKRISFDFTDVFGSGVSFDRALASLTVADGLGAFSMVRPRSRAPVLRFDIDGSVDFESGALDYTMVGHADVGRQPALVCCPSSPRPTRSWRRGYCSASRFSKDSIRRLASSEVVVRGTYDDPQVVVVGTGSALAIAGPDDGPPGGAEPDGGDVDIANTSQEGRVE